MMQLQDPPKDNRIDYGRSNDDEACTIEDNHVESSKDENSIVETTVEQSNADVQTSPVKNNQIDGD